MRHFMRLALTMGSVAAAGVLLSACASEPQAPYCLMSPAAPGGAMGDCSYFTLKQCTADAVAGTRGLCSPNPRYHRQRRR